MQFKHIALRRIRRVLLHFLLKTFPNGRKSALGRTDVPSLAKHKHVGNRTIEAGITYYKPKFFALQFFS